jgi:hypothetical protein
MRVEFETSVIGCHFRGVDKEAKRRRLLDRVLLRWAIAALVLAVLGAGWAAWRGPAAAFRWAVRTYDPALRLKVGSASFRQGELLLRDIELHLRGRDKPVLVAKELAAGLGPDWHRGRLGSLVVTGPLVNLDSKAIEHLAKGNSGGGMSLPWEFAKVEVHRGHVWIAGFGESGMDVSANVDGVMERFGPSSPDQIHLLELSRIYTAVHDGEAVLPVLGAGRAEFKFNLAGLQQRQVSGLRVEQGWMIAGVGLQRLMAGGGETLPAEADGSTIIESLDLVKMQVQPDGLPGGLPEVRLSVTSALRDVALGSVAGELGETVHQVEFGDVELLSPTDPLRRALTIRSVFVKFTLAGLVRRDLEELTLLGPTVYVGEPLFEYMQSADNPSKLPEAVKETEGWNVREMKVNFGRVVIAVGGRQQVGLPLAFYTTARNLSLSSLAGLNVELVLKVPEEDYEFPAYNLSLGGVRGDLRFNYPPDMRRNNLVNVVRFDRARWRNFQAGDLWVSATFDSKGINGLFGGRAYRGYVNGGFSFFLQPDSPWTGWIGGEGVDLGPLTEDGAPQHVVMTGLADFKVEANGRATVVERVKGEVTAIGKGRLVINKLNDMLAAIPNEWAALKSESSRVTLETLRDFDYTDARSDFWFVGKQGIINVRMKGPAGGRNLDMVFHGTDGQTAARWQQGGRR